MANTLGLKEFFNQGNNVYAMDDFVWIRTRDNSPTLWNNSLGEGFRSYKGAFSESWGTFIEPLLEKIKENSLNTLFIGEFGLGPGTNWALISTLAYLKNFTVHYFAIEKDIRSFEMGQKYWNENKNSLYEFVTVKLGGTDNKPLCDFKLLPPPMIFNSLKDALIETKNCHKADFWFHDPFGYAVNPDGYSLETLKVCAELCNDKVLGLSYACHRPFQEVLKALNFEVKTPEQKNPQLKRQRLEFFRSELKV
jgi:hypothetical protein